MDDNDLVADRWALAYAVLEVCHLHHHVVVEGVVSLAGVVVTEDFHHHLIWSLSPLLCLFSHYVVMVVAMMLAQMEIFHDFFFHMSF